MTRRMSRWGAGPATAVAGLLYAAGAYAVDRATAPRFAIGLLPAGVRQTLGIAMMVLGLLWYIPSVIAVMRAYNRGTLCTSGPYALCRHPIMASWMLLITPGIILIWLPSWLMLSVPLVVCAVFLRCVGREEDDLEARFGEDYRQYRRNVNALLPMPPKGKGARE